MRRTLALFGAVAITLGALLLAAAPGIGLTTEPAADTGSPGDSRLHLVSVSDWVGPTAVFHAEVDLRDVRDTASVTFTLHQAVSDRRSLDRSIAGEQLGGTLLQGRASIAADDPARAVVDIPVSDRWPAPEGGVVLFSSGVHPLVITALGSDGAGLATIVTQLIRLPATETRTAPLAIGLIVEQRETPSIALDGGTFLTPAADDHLLASLRTLDAFPSVPLSTLPSASTLIGLNLTRPDIDESGFASLRPAPTRQLLASTYAPIAVGSWLAADLRAETEDQFTAGADTLRRQLGAPPDHHIAVLDPSIDPPALALLHERGATSVIVPADQLLPAIDSTRTPAPTSGFDVRTPGGDRLHAIAADPAVSTRLRADDGADPTAAAHSALADLALIGLTSPGTARGLAVVVPGATPVATLRTLLAALADADGAAAGAPGSPLLSPVTLDDLFAITDVSTTYDSTGRVPVIKELRSTEPLPLGGYPIALRTTRRSIDGVRSMVPESQYLVGGAVHQSLSSGDRLLTEDQRNGVLASAEGSLLGITGEVVMTAQQVVTLTSHSGRVPLNIENRLQVPAHVHVILRSAKLDFPEGSEFDQVLAPGTTTRVDAQVTTKASGAFPLEVSVTTADQSMPVTSARFTVRSTAVSGIGLIISIGAGLFLLIWWIRHFRSARRASALIADDYAPGTDPNPGDP